MPTRLHIQPALLAAVCIMLCSYPVTAQDNPVADYLEKHSYPFSLSTGFTPAMEKMLTEKLQGYRLVLQAEGGSHYLGFYNDLRLLWFDFLRAHFGTTAYFAEFGTSTAIVYNHYLQTGDTSFLHFRGRAFWERLRKFNLSVSEEKRIYCYGMDFESAYFYIAAQQLILPNRQPDPAIAAAVEQIKNADPYLRDCDYIMAINNSLAKDLAKNQPLFKAFYGNSYADFERMVLNGATCKDTRRNRNPNLAANFLARDKELQHNMYFGELGMAHTVQTVRTTAASIIQRSAQLNGKLAVVNVYCDNCVTTEEGMSSNWQLARIETDIQQYFLPRCRGDFTLFDLSSDDPAISKYRAYGPFLIIARNQH